MDDKLQYISKIKEERNKAQDELAELRKILELSDDISLLLFRGKLVTKEPMV